MTLLVPPPPGRKAPDEELLEEIQALAERVENGAYCTGWGWDDELREERDWGDESWADEMDDLFGRARDALFNGDYKLAEEAYAGLFAILAMGEEPGHLPGHPDPAEMLATDLEEARLCYLRAVYLAAPPARRPARLLEAVQESRYWAGGRVSLQEINAAGPGPLPDFRQFLSGWIDLLQKTGTEQDLLREAVKLSGGIPALAELARRQGQQYPKTYVEWLSALEEKEDYPAMLAAAQEGLAAVPRDYVVRAEIAAGLVRAAQKLGDAENQLTGWREAFYSNPDLDSFLHLLTLAGQKGCREEEVEAAAARVASLCQENSKRTEYFYPPEHELRTAKASQILLGAIYLLTGQHDGALNLCRGKEALGWHYGQNPKGLVIPFFLMLLARGKDARPAPNLEQLWKEAVALAGEGGGAELQERFRQAMDSVFREVRLSEEEEEKYLRWCLTGAGRRVDAIVGEKHRQSYPRAANLLVAVAEVLAKRGRKPDGAALLQKYHQKYQRHRAFREDLKVAAARSGIY
ncbi:MAG: hypothetical protein K6U04_15390 [Armatimonadetes bacterium]|nr:hypothetical protein [Armatimonadota bacterium]